MQQKQAVLAFTYFIPFFCFFVFFMLFAAKEEMSLLQ